MARHPYSAPELPASQQPAKAVLIEDRHTQLPGLVVFRPGSTAGDDVGGLLDLFGVVAGEAVSEPVTTMALQSARNAVSHSSAIRTAAERHLSTIARCQSAVNHSMTAAAMVGPTPSMAISCSVDAEAVALQAANSVSSAQGVCDGFCHSWFSC